MLLQPQLPDDFALGDAVSETGEVRRELGGGVIEFRKEGRSNENFRIDFKSLKSNFSYVRKLEFFDLCFALLKLYQPAKNRFFDEPRIELIKIYKNVLSVSNPYFFSLKTFFRVRVRVFSG